jgi:hypothetical protein
MVARQTNVLFFKLGTRLTPPLLLGPVDLFTGGDQPWLKEQRQEHLVERVKDR